MLTKSKYEKITKEAEQLLSAVNQGVLSVPRITTFLKELTGEKKAKRDHRSILESKIK